MIPRAYQEASPMTAGGLCFARTAAGGRIAVQSGPFAVDRPYSRICRFRLSHSLVFGCLSQKAVRRFPERSSLRWPAVPSVTQTGETCHSSGFSPGPHPVFFHSGPHRSRTSDACQSSPAGPSGALRKFSLPSFFPVLSLSPVCSFSPCRSPFHASPSASMFLMPS